MSEQQQQSPPTSPLELTIKYAPVMPMETTVQQIKWQDDATNEIVEKLYDKPNYRGVVLRGGTGLGKMYITANALRIALQLGKIRPIAGSINPIPVLWICPKSLRMQTQRCLKEHGIAHLVLVMSYGQLKNADGIAMFIQYMTRVLPGGQPDMYPEWYLHMLPSVVVCDEIQKVKNRNSMVSKTIHWIPDTVKWIGMSATPWQRVSDAEVHLVRCGAICKGYNALPATMATAPAILRGIAEPKHPDEYSPSAVGRLRDALEPYIVELKNVRFKFPTKTACVSISFRTVQEQRAYEAAYEEYISEMWELKKVRKQHWGVIKKWVAMQKFQQKAEFIRCGEIAERAVIRVKEGKQVIIASNYVETLRQVWRILDKVHGFDVSRLSFVVGGQTELARQRQVDKFQEGQSDIILFTMRSGGVGLSMHHDRITTRPRHIILPPTWSAIDLVQALGRGHRLTSLSPTTQEILWYRGTVEDRVKEVVERKTKCIAKSVTAKEQFITLFDKTVEEMEEQQQEATIAEESDELNEALAEEKHKGETEATANDVDSAGSGEDDITGEGLDSSDEVVFPAPYYTPEEKQ